MSRLLRAMTSSFPIFPLSRFEQAGKTTIRRPREFLFFSFDEKHDLKVGSNDSLRYYYPPFAEAPGTQVTPLNLSNGFESFIRTDETVDFHIDALLESIQSHEQCMLGVEAKLNDVKTQADIVTWRGMMTNVR